MPRRPKKPCSYPGCPKLTNGRYCEEHQKQENKRYERYERNPATKKRYGEKSDTANSGEESERSTHRHTLSVSSVLKTV